VSATAARLAEARTRDRTLEGLLEAIGRPARRRFGADSRRFAEAVRRRLRAGDKRFGAAFLDRDNVSEALEEAWDLGAYVILELDRLKRDGRLTAAVRDDLLRALLLAAAADHYLRRAGRARRREDAR